MDPGDGARRRPSDLAGGAGAGGAGAGGSRGSQEAITGRDVQAAPAVQPVQAAVEANVAAVRARVERACARAGRDPAGVRLLPVTKTVPADVLRAARAAGLRRFGENRVQEATAKAAALADLDVEWVLVGHLQRNKARDIGAFAEFQALDDAALAAALDRRLAAAGRTLDVLVQVNTSGEDTKSGVPPAGLPALLDRLRDFPALRVRGLMTIAALTGDEALVRGCFRLLRRLRDEARARSGDPDALPELSMGMSGDLELAVEEGSTVVRVGQAIFGRRPPRAG